MPQTVTNWFGNIDLEPGVVVHATSAKQIAEIVLDEESYPSPVRAGGSHHSTTACGVVDGGTLVITRAMNRIISIGEDHVTAEAGALYIDVAKALAEHGMQFFVNVEIGNLTMGSAACGGTKDASMPGEFGQVNSYVIGMKMVTATGDLVEITEDDPELLQAMRSSYGLCGIVYEVTFRIRPQRPMAVHHEGYSLAEFAKRLPGLRTREEAMMFYIDPFNDHILIEFRRYVPYGFASDHTSWQWKLRNYVWSKGAPYTSFLLSTKVGDATRRFATIDFAYKWTFAALERFVHGGHTFASDQMIRYPEESDNTRYTFSIWAFPSEQYAQTISEYFAWVRDYYARTGFRPDMPHVGYRIAADQQGLFSYSFNGPVMTIDPVSTGQAGWDEFLAAYNEFCSDHNGVPLFNQTHLITREQVQKAFGARVQTFAKVREEYDPNNRFLTRFFRERLT